MIRPDMRPGAKSIIFEVIFTDRIVLRSFATLFRSSTFDIFEPNIFAPQNSVYIIRISSPALSWTRKDLGTSLGTLYTAKETLYTSSFLYLVTYYHSLGYLRPSGTQPYFLVFSNHFSLCILVSSSTFHRLFMTSDLYLYPNFFYLPFCLKFVYKAYVV